MEISLMKIMQKPGPKKVACGMEKFAAHEMKNDECTAMNFRATLADMRWGHWSHFFPSVFDPRSITFTPFGKLSVNGDKQKRFTSSD